MTTILPCAQEEAPAPTCYGLDIGALSLVAAKDDGELLRAGPVVTSAADKVMLTSEVGKEAARKDGDWQEGAISDEASVKVKGAQ